MTQQHQARDCWPRCEMRCISSKAPWRTRDGVDDIASQTERLRASVEALGALRQREATAVGIEMFVDAAVDLLEAFRELESGILDVQAEVDTLEAEMADDENGREA
jgi:hypothetical protein